MASSAHATAKDRTTTALDAVIARMPFTVRAIQVDGGSEFMAAFEQASADRSIHLCSLPPQLNGRVQRSHRTHWPVRQSGRRSRPRTQRPVAV